MMNSDLKLHFQPLHAYLASGMAAEASPQPPRAFALPGLELAHPGRRHAAEATVTGAVAGTAPTIANSLLRCSPGAVGTAAMQTPSLSPSSSPSTSDFDQSDDSYDVSSWLPSAGTLPRGLRRLIWAAIASMVG